MAEDLSTPISPQRREWSIKEIRDLVQRKFRKRACWMQIKIALAIRAGKDVVACARTGAGKTLSFYIALLMDIEDGLDKMIILVTPLNLLGKQNVAGLEKAGLPAIAVSAENASTKTFKVSQNKLYRVVVINPEILMTHPEVSKLWKWPLVTRRISYFVFDEAHCIVTWGKFREQYTKLGDLRYLIPEDIPFFVASATLPPAILLEILKLLHLRTDNMAYIMRSNDRPEIRIMVQGMVFPANSYKDLDFLIPEGYALTDDPIPAFLVFFDNTKEAEAACRHLEKRLPGSLKSKVRYFHSMMTSNYREEELTKMEDGTTWGLCCTDAFGMGMDISNIQVVVQWKAPSDLSTLWQRFGCAARGAGQEGVGILIVPSTDIYENRVRKADKAAKRKEKAQEGIGTKRKATRTDVRPAKRRALADESNQNRAPQADAAQDGPSNIFEGDSDMDSDNEEVEQPRPVIVEAYVDLAERQLQYAKEGQTTAQEKKKVTKRNEVEVGSALDDFINAGPLGFKCRRVPPRLYFRNDKDRECRL
ncbi:P-loop containing nucleoside triphosphate hydrolase protein [Pholiota molesta]|nr:P-loop containing nucleoside triphosphate hydrolase protein [Pholiota molesta]